MRRAKSAPLLHRLRDAVPDAIADLAMSLGDGRMTVDEVTRFNIKAFGYELARSLARALPTDVPAEPGNVGLGWQPSTQADLESPWAAYWCAQLKIPVVFHRKIWEFAYVLQALSERGALYPGMRGLGFGCGHEPLPSYFASRRLKVTVTDLAPDAAAAAGWIATGQHASRPGDAYMPHLVDRETFDANVSAQFVDMNRIPDSLSGYDFCWSICALEHLGSIEQGLAFVENAMATLREGGVAVHTTEFNFLNDEKTIDNWPTVLFQRRHFEDLARRLQGRGHTIAPLSFDVGNQVLDRFIDIPPYLNDWPEGLRRQWGDDAPHLKLLVDGYASTCFGLVVHKG